jgi:hypothetical protein
MKTIRTHVFTFDELSESAKERAREWFRACVDSNDYDAVISDAAEILEMLGFELKTRNIPLMNGKTRAEPCIYWRGFYNQGDGASFEANYKYKRGSVAAVRAFAPNDARLHAIAERLQAIQKPFFYGLTARIYTRGNYTHEYTMQAEAEYNRDETRAIIDAEADILECARDLARWVYRNLETENEWINSNEYIDETISANEYTFTENGARFG